MSAIAPILEIGRPLAAEEVAPPPGAAAKAAQSARQLFQRLKNSLPGSSSAAAEAVRPNSSLNPNNPRWENPFLRRIKPEEREAIREAIQEEFKRHRSEIRNVAKIRTIDPKSKTGYKEKTARILHHYLEGNIDASEAARLLLYETCREHVATAPPGSPAATPVGTHRLVGAQSEESFRLLREGFPAAFDEEDWEALKVVIQKHPNESWDFFTVTYPGTENPDPVAQQRSSFLCRLRVQNQQLGFIPCGGAKPDTLSPMTALVIPPQLWDRMMEVRFGKQRIGMRCVLGHSDIETLTRPESRVVGTPCTFVATPKVLHEVISANLLDFYIHDVYYHNLIDSANPHRSLWINIAKLFQQVDPPAFQQIVDRDFACYAYGGFNNELKTMFRSGADQGKHYISPAIGFWMSLVVKVDVLKYPELVAQILDLIVSEHPSLAEPETVAAVLQWAFPLIIRELKGDEKITRERCTTWINAVAARAQPAAAAAEEKDAAD